jgi:CheY-like chemotaxis protein
MNSSDQADKRLDFLAAPKPGPLTVLLCEDDALIRMATTELLEDLGHVVIDTDTASAALAALAENRIDILMTDIGLPDMPGTQLAERARRHRPGLPVIFATGHSEIDGFSPDAKTAILLKPYDIATIEEAIEKVRPAASAE